MVDLVNDLGAFLVALCKNWISLVSGIFSVVTWGLAAGLEPMPVSMRWTFLAFGMLGLIVAAFEVWRQERGRVVTGKRRLHLLRIARDGEKCLAACDSIPPGGAEEAMDAVTNLNEWHRETLAFLKASCAAHWEHFADIDAFDADQEGLERAATLLQRIRDVAESATQILR